MQLIYLVSNFYPRSPCGERRNKPNFTRKIKSNFYPRSPCGERPHNRRSRKQRHRFLSTLSLRRATNDEQFLPTVLVFLSTLSLRRATALQGLHWQKTNISIHALLAESDSAARAALAENQHFYPRSPCGERRPGGRPCQYAADFYPRSPCGERLSRQVL